ncbi:MAG: NAD-dependent epimerase/dehydratase family protein [Defluviitaleaceae bacterium]|nr:NAD-dependent epimerase/dehydratase family protein [Defluviitaleaceae bacterium]
MSGLRRAGGRVLVVGAGSYIGDSFARYARGRLHVDVVDSYEGWKAASFHEYDCVLMAAGIAHQRWNRKQQEANKDKYFAVNHELAVAVAKKAKDGGVGQFIYLSSMAVFGRVEGVITAGTKAIPRDGDYYGLSKFMAEAELASLFETGQAEPPSLEGGASEGGGGCTVYANRPTTLCIVRPPMVYGPGCPGKFAALVKVAKKLPVIPKVNNRRSMIFIDNLCEFLCLAAEHRISGVFHPQNNEHMNTTWLIRAVAEAMGKQPVAVPGLGLIVRLVKPFSAAIQTAFGSLYYDESMMIMPFKDDYQLVSAKESAKRSI